MLVGKVKWFDCKKGFGFIVGPENQDVFVHFSVIEGQGFRRLRDGENVEYEVTLGAKGMSACLVRKMDTPPLAEDTPENTAAESQ